MRRISSLLLFAAGLAAAPAVPQLTVDQILARHEQAMGGAAKLNAIESLKITASGLMNGQMETTVVTYAKRPAMFRLEMTMMSRKFIQAFDGTTAWRINPMQGPATPLAMTPSETREILDSAEFHGPLIDWKSKGHKIELLGQEEVKNRPAYKLRITRKSGKVSQTWIDANTFLVLKNSSLRMQMGREVEVESFPEDFRKVNGVMTAYSTKSFSEGRPIMAVTVTSAEVNLEMEDDLFRMPGPK